MAHLNCSRGFYHHLRMALFQAAEHVHVLREPQLGMQAAHDVELARGIIPRGIRFGEHLVQAARVGAVFLRHAREGTEDAGVAQDADIGRIDVLIRREVNALAVPTSIGKVGQPTDGQQVVRCKKREAILARQPFATFNFRGDGNQLWVRPTVRPSGRHATLRTASVTLCPPKPNELDSATSTCRLTAWFGAESRSQAESGLNWLIVGGITPFCSASAQIANSNAPAAPSRCPVIDLVEPKMSLRAWSPNTALTAAVSAASPCGVDVPCALM